VSAIKCFWVEKTADGTAWTRIDTGEVMPYAYAFGDGALWSDLTSYDVQTYAEGLAKRYPDGLRLRVRTPGGEWDIDGPSYSDGAHACPWTRTGDPRRPETLTVTPSINFPGRYHGWLRNGQLVLA